MWVVTGVAYSYSGFAKLSSPSWVAGRSIGLLLASPLARDTALVGAAASAPPALLRIATLAMLALEVGYLPLALWPRAVHFYG